MKKIIRNMQQYIADKQVRIGMVFCCLMLIYIYYETKELSRIGLLPDGFVLSRFVLWMAGLLGLVLWLTWRGSRMSYLLPAEVPEWAAFGGFILMEANLLYALLPQSFQELFNAPLHQFLLPAVLVGGAFVFLVCMNISKINKRYEEEQQLRILEKEKLEEEKKALELEQIGIKQQLQNAKDAQPGTYCRLLLTNQPVIHLSVSQMNTLASECLYLDRPFMKWLEDNDITLTSRQIIFCTLIRLNKSKEEIGHILGFVTDESYRSFKYRVINTLKKYTEVESLTCLLQNIDGSN